MPAAVECDATPIDIGDSLSDRSSTLHFSQAIGSFQILTEYTPSFDTASRLEPGEHFISERGESSYADKNYSILMLRKSRFARFETIQPERHAAIRDDITGFSFSKSGSEIYIAFLSGVVRIVQLDGKSSDDRRVLRGHIGGISHLAHDTGQYKFTTYGLDGTIRFWSDSPSFSWYGDDAGHDENSGLNSLTPMINYSDFHVRTDILAEMLTNKKDEFVEKMDHLLETPDFEWIKNMRKAVPRCLHPEQRRLVSIPKRHAGA